MKTRRLGKTGLEVSEIGIGGEGVRRLKINTLYWKKFVEFPPDSP